MALEKFTENGFTVTIENDVELYGQWASGECYGYVITDEYGEEAEASWGFYGYEDVTSEAKQVANGLKHTVKCNGTLNRGTGKIDHAGECPLHDAS